MVKYLQNNCNAAGQAPVRKRPDAPPALRTDIATGRLLRPPTQPRSSR